MLVGDQIKVKWRMHRAGEYERVDTSMESI